MEKGLFYQCRKCGNIAALLKPSGVALSCCGEEMVLLAANSTDASKEKHVPQVSLENGRIKVSVGSVIHPMADEHYIEWIALVTDDREEFAYLKPGKEPSAVSPNHINYDREPYTGENDEIVPNCEGSPCNFVLPKGAEGKVVVYAYCNLHGLWKNEFKL